jgi:hypothetical protein
VEHSVSSGLEVFHYRLRQAAFYVACTQISIRCDWRQLTALDDGAAFFTPIPCDSAVHRFELFELVAFVARSVKTFRAVAVAQFVRRHSQMAVLAAQSFLSFGQKFESGVIATTHGDL